MSLANAISEAKMNFSKLFAEKTNIFSSLDSALKSSRVYIANCREWNKMVSFETIMEDITKEDVYSQDLLLNYDKNKDIHSITVKVTYPNGISFYKRFGYQ